MPHHDELLGLLPIKLPMQNIAPAVSPFTYTAPSNGRVVVSGGNVSTIELGRTGVFVAIGLLAGIVPVSKDDQVRVTYLVAPTMTYLQG